MSGLQFFLRYVLMSLWAVLLVVPMARASDVSVFAAASLGGVLREIATLWADETGGTLTPVLAGSSAIARQIEAGAPADVVILANADWMDVLEAGAVIAPETRRTLLTNRLVLIGQIGDASIDLDAPEALIERVGDDRLALALTQAVPAGIYARAALENLGLWPALQPNVVEADNVRAALALVAAGAAPYGIVYATDAMAEPRVAVLAEVPEDLHAPILYPVAAVATGEVEVAARFLAFLATAPVEQVFRAHGFGLAPSDQPDD